MFCLSLVHSNEPSFFPIQFLKHYRSSTFTLVFFKRIVPYSPSLSNEQKSIQRSFADIANSPFFFTLADNLNSFGSNQLLWYYNKKFQFFLQIYYNWPVTFSLFSVCYIRHWTFPWMSFWWLIYLFPTTLSDNPYSWDYTLDWVLLIYCFIAVILSGNILTEYINSTSQHRKCPSALLLSTEMFSLSDYDIFFFSFLLVFWFPRMTTCICKIVLS